MRKAFFALLALPAALIVMLAPLGQAQAKWPDKPVKIILPFGAGGVADVTSRIMAAKLSDKLGQQVIIENMPGPGGINAARAVITAPPDGYTMALVTNGTSISVAAFNKLPFDPVKDFSMVSMVGTFDLVFAVDAKSDFKTLQDFMTAAKANPGKFNVGTVLLGGTQNLGAELFKSMTRLNFQVNAGKIRLLATSSPERTGLLPNLPTVDEAGVKGYEVISWNAVAAPKGTPKDVIEIMNKAMHEVLASQELKAQFNKVGVEPHASTPEELEARLTGDIKKWDAVIAKAHIPKK